MADVVQAWLLQVGGPCPVALGEHEIVDVLDYPRIHHLPVGPLHCRQAVIWQGQSVPLVDLSVLGATEGEAADEMRMERLERPHFVLIAGYAATPEAAAEYGAIILRTPPSSIQVSDDLAVPLPADLPDQWKQLALSCFRYGSINVVVPDLGRIFLPQT